LLAFQVRDQGSQAADQGFRPSVATAAFKHPGFGGQKICRAHQINDLAAKVAQAFGVRAGAQNRRRSSDAWPSASR